MTLFVVYVSRRQEGEGELARFASSLYFGETKINLDREKGKGMESLSDKAISRMIKFLRNKGWTEKEINDFLEYIVRQ